MDDDSRNEKKEDWVRVDTILICRERHGGRIPVTAGNFEVDHGLIGDAHAGPGDRQVPLFCVAGRARLAEGPSDGLCFARFQETVRLDGFDTAKLGTGDRLQGAEITLEVSPEPKRCFPECAIVARGGRCALADGVRFASVVVGGALRVGEPLAVVPADAKPDPAT